MFPRTADEMCPRSSDGERARRSDRRPRRRHGFERRRDSARGRHHDRLRAHEPHPRNRSGKRARRGAARRRQPGYHAGRSGERSISTRPILPASAPAPSAATSRRTPAGRTRWPTASRPITCSGWKWCCRTAPIIETGGKEPDLPGYDLTGLLTGSEGTMALVTKVIVRLMRQPEVGEDDSGDLRFDRRCGRHGGRDHARARSRRSRSRCWTA